MLVGRYLISFPKELNFSDSYNSLSFKQCLEHLILSGKIPAYDSRRISNLKAILAGNSVLDIKAAVFALYKALEISLEFPKSGTSQAEPTHASPSPSHLYSMD